MRLRRMNFVRRLRKDESGQSMVLLACGMLVFVGLAGVSLDLGHVYLAYQQLLQSTNAAVLAGAQALPETDTAQSNVTLYSSVAGGLNQSGLLTNASVTTTFSCLTSVTDYLGIPCVPSTGSTAGSFNAMSVVQKAFVPAWFGKVFGMPGYNISAQSSAVPKSLAPLNVAVILDATLSQNSTDDNCVVNSTTLTEMQCELSGVQNLLQALFPCAASYTTCVVTNGVATASIDRVAIFTFPAVTANSAYIDAGCSVTPVTSTGSSSWVSKHGGSQGSTGAKGWNIGTGSTASYGVFDMDGGTVGGYSFSGPSGANTGAWPFWPIAAAYTSPGGGSSVTSYSPGTGTASTYEVSLCLGSGDANGFFSDYRTQDLISTLPASRPLNPSSLLVNLTGAGAGGTGCPTASTSVGGPATAPTGGVATPNYDGDYGTFYAGAIYAAQAALTAEKTANPGSDNVIIFLSDGDANSTGSMLGTPLLNAVGGALSGTNSCGEAVAAAQYATLKGTTVYTIAYGSETTGCTNDNDGYTPCTTMEMMASGAVGSGGSVTTQSQYFYSVYDSGSDTACQATGTYSAHNNTNLTSLFAYIGASLAGRARLIPNGAS